MLHNQSSHADDIVQIVRRDLRAPPFILDGEVVALDASGRPLPFQELMRRFRRVRGVEAAAGALPLTLHLFDCLMADGRSYLDEPYARRWEMLERVTGGRWGCAAWAASRCGWAAC